MNLLLQLFVCCSGNGVCATVPTDTLREVEVRAMRPIKGTETAAPLQRLDSADFVRRGITDTGDALRRFAGVNLRDYGGAGGLKTVSVRGLGASHTAVTYDGLSVSDTRQGQIDLNRFNADRLGSIELQVLDGDELLCPVRNLAAAVIKLSSLKSASADHRLHGTVSLAQASFGTWNPALMLHQSFASGTYVSLSGDYFRAENDYPFIVENGVASQRLHRTNSKMQTADGEFNVAQELKGGKVEAKVSFYHNDRRLPGPVILYVNENDESLLEQNALGQLRWRQRFGRWAAFAAGKYNWQKSLYDDIDAQYPGGALRQHYWQREAYTTAGLSYDLTDWLHAAYATDYAHSSINSNLTTDRPAWRDTWLQSVSLQLKTERCEATARGVVHLYWNGAESGAAAKDAQKITPSFAASYLAVRSPLRLRLRAGYKESFRLPTFTESYFYHLGSQSLNPELTRQFSAGLTLQAAPFKWWKTLALTMDGYINKVSDRIVSVPVNLFLWRTINMGNVRTAGLDLTLQSQWQPARKHALWLAVNYSLQRSADRTVKGSDTYGNQLAYTPIHSGAASLSWESPWLNLTAHTTFAAERWSTNEHTVTTKLPAYMECGFAANRAFQFKKGIGMELRADLVNAFNKRYEVLRRYPMPGRSYKLTVKLKF